jgi:hypothetical protein
MGLEFYEAILHTGNRTEESIRQQAKEENWIGSLKDKDIQNIINSGKHFDGCQVGVAKKTLRGDGFTLGFWREEDDSKIKEALWYLELDEYFGSYSEDERVEFDDAWAAGEYEAGGSISFNLDEVEIIGVLGKDWTVKGAVIDE